MALTNAYLLVVLVAVLVSLYLRSNVISEVSTNNKDQLAPIVQLAGGQVQGIVQLTEEHGKVYFYQGIRYGHANRFELAKPAEPWTEVYNATTYREACPQLSSQRMFGRIMSLLSKTEIISEDCLFVNVWRPAEDSKSKRAVMFWIHGGAFETGTIFTQAYDGRYLAHRGNVIVVSVNYRLGAFGFLTGGDVPGNLGLHDQILALKWVHKNIEKFGGDPNQLTIFGESAGGISVGALILSPLTKGLFKRAILQSGAQSGFYTSESKAQSLAKSKNLAQKLKCPIEKIEETIKCLKAKPMDDILKASQDAFTTNQLFLPIYGDDLMPVKPQEALKAGKFNQDLDLMYGVTKDEGSMFALALFPELRSAETKLTVNSTKDDIVKLMKHYYQNFGEEVAEFYFGKLKQEPAQDDLRSAIGHVWGDYHLVCPTFLFAEFYAKQNPKNHFYSYQLVVPFSIPNMTIPSWVGVFHTTDLFFLFMIPLTQTTYEHYELSLDMIQAWTQFAKTGHPGKMRNVDWVDSFDGERKLSTSKTIILDPIHYQMVEGAYKETCDVFWKPKIFN